MAEKEYLGEWWIPGGFNDRVAGVLTFSREDGGELCLISPLEESTASHFRKEDAILGVANGDKLTLQDCRVTGGGRTMFGSCFPTFEVLRTVQSLRYSFEGSRPIIAEVVSMPLKAGGSHASAAFVAVVLEYSFRSYFNAHSPELR